MSTPTVLPASALAQLAPAIPGRPSLIAAPALARAALWLAPVPLALAAAGPLTQLPWQVPVAALGLAWIARAALLSLSRSAGERPTAAARLALIGFGLVAVGWSAGLVIWHSTGGLAGALPQAYAVSLSLLGLATAATVGQAVGAELAILWWSLPALAVAGATIAGWLPDPGGPPIAGWLLPLALALPLLRTVPLAVRPRIDYGTVAPERRWRYAAAHALLAAGQAVTLVALWRAGTVTAPLAAVLPVLISLPAVEWWASAHTARLAASLARHDDPERHHLQLRRRTRAALAVLLPPLVIGVALLAGAHRLPYQLSGHPDPPLLVLGLAGGILLAALLALGSLLAGRSRPGLAALITAGPAVAAAVTVWSPLPTWLAAAPLPVVVTVLAVGYPTALVLSVPALLDPRSAPAAPTASRPRSHR